MKNSKQTTVELVKKLLAVLVVFAIMLSHCAIVGSYAVEAANEILESQKTIDKGENVEFDAYFEENNEQTHTPTLNADEMQTLHIKVEVKDKVNIPKATIKIEDPNFEINEESLQENKYVTKVDTKTNEIEVSNISSNNTALIELPITLKKSEKVDKNYFNKELAITIKGKYGNVNQKERDLEGEVKIQPQWTSNTEVEMNQSIQKYFSLGGNGTLLEEQIEIEVKNNTLPRETENIETKVPNLGNGNPTKVIALIDGEKIEENQVEYNQEEGTVKISYANQIDEEGNINWKTNKKVYNLMYQYENAVQVEEKAITLSTKAETKLYSKTETINKEETKEEIARPIGNIATVSTTLYGDLYKGYLYENETKEITYEENNEVSVSYTEGIENVNLETNANTYLNENGEGVIPAENIRYTQTKINKNDLISLLGEEGRINVKRTNGEEITTIGNETETDEEGNIVINYQGEEKQIIFETTKPQKEGKINIIKTKAISGKTDQPKEIIRNIKNLAVNPKVTTNMSSEGTTAVIETKETRNRSKTRNKQRQINNSKYKSRCRNKSNTKNKLTKSRFIFKP